MHRKSGQTSTVRQVACCGRGNSLRLNVQPLTLMLSRRDAPSHRLQVGREPANGGGSLLHRRRVAYYLSWEEPKNLGRRLRKRFQHPRKSWWS